MSLALGNTFEIDNKDLHFPLFDPKYGSLNANKESLQKVKDSIQTLEQIHEWYLELYAKLGIIHTMSKNLSNIIEDSK